MPSPLISLLVGQEATSDRLSPQVKSTTTSVWYQPSLLGWVVGPPSTVGGVLSILMPLSDALTVLPALSDTLTGPAPRSVPSPVIVLSSGCVLVSTPDSPSDAVQRTVTSWLYQPSALGSVAGAPARCGAVRSMLMSSTVASLPLPALSCALPVTLWPAPWFSSRPPPMHPAIPDSASSQVKPTRTGVLFQPLAFAVGVRLGVIVGGTPSILSVRSWPSAVPSSTFPALSTLQ